ncbi:NUDIX domain-containing protein [Candidatus Woesearchaeota archaeon]|nr:NUDIX domain-containing protein [Candidatus Woesearchaeota archaeon]
MSERIDLVDENDRVIATCPRDHPMRRHYIMRNVVVCLEDDGRHVLQVRAEGRIFAGCYDFAACGAVHAGETYAQAAVRELEEELGVSCPLDFLGKRLRIIVMGGQQQRIFTGLFHVKYTGVYVPNPIEVSEIVHRSAAEIEEMIRSRARGIEDYFVEEWMLFKELKGN